MMSSCVYIVRILKTSMHPYKIILNIHFINYKTLYYVRCIYDFDSSYEITKLKYVEKILNI